MARTDGDPEAWARSAWQKAHAAKEATTDAREKQALEALEHLAHAVELLALRMQNVSGYNS